MKIIFEHYDMRYTIEGGEQDYDANELKRLFERMLVAAGYPPSVIEFEDGSSYEWVGENEIVVKKWENDDEIKK